MTAVSPKGILAVSARKAQHAQTFFTEASVCKDGSDSKRSDHAEMVGVAQTCARPFRVLMYRRIIRILYIKCAFTIMGADRGVKIGIYDS